MSETVFVLLLNDMRYSNVENCCVVAVANNRKHLVEWAEEQKHPETEKNGAVQSGWKDGQWGKFYRKGSDLEWFNTPFEVWGQGVFGMGPYDFEELHAYLKSSPFARCNIGNSYIVGMHHSGSAIDLRVIGSEVQ